MAILCFLFNIRQCLFEQHQKDILVALQLHNLQLGFT